MPALVPWNATVCFKFFALLLAVFFKWQSCFWSHYQGFQMIRFVPNALSVDILGKIRRPSFLYMIKMSRKCAVGNIKEIRINASTHGLTSVSNSDLLNELVKMNKFHTFRRQTTLLHDGSWLKMHESPFWSWGVKSSAWIVLLYFCQEKVPLD